MDIVHLLFLPDCTLPTRSDGVDIFVKEFVFWGTVLRFSKMKAKMKKRYEIYKIIQQPLSNFFPSWTVSVRINGFAANRFLISSDTGEGE